MNSKTPSKKQLAVAEAIRQVVASIIVGKEIYHPFFEEHLVAFPLAKVSADLKVATVYIDCLRSELIPEVIQILQSYAVQVRRIVASKLKLRYVPELRFMRDDVTEREGKVLKIIDNIAASRIQES